MIDAPGWESLADSLLLRAALTARLGFDRAPNPLAGYTVDDAEVDALLAGLPGLDREPPLVVADDLRKVLDEADDRVHEARRDFEAWLEGGLDGAGRFPTLCEHARLGLVDAEVLALLLAVEVDPRRQRLVGYIADDITLRRLTMWTLRLVAGDAALAAAAPTGALRRACLLAPAGGDAWAAQPLAVAPTVVWFVAGDDGPDPALPSTAETYRTGLTGGGAGVVAVVSGRDRVRRIEAVAGAVARPSVIATPPPDDAPGWEALVRWASLTGAAVALEFGDGMPGAARRRIEEAWHLSWGICSPSPLAVADLPDRPWVAVDPAPAVATTQEWADAFGGERPDGADAYRLTADQLRAVSRAAPAFGGNLAEAVRRLAGQVSGTAERIRPARTWDDLILDPERAARVQEVAIRCRHRTKVFDEWGLAPQPSTGVVALFAGPSGTGKTLAAEVIAGEVGVDLFKVDLANMVSKYIGETEKNLSAIFDAAEASNVALFFDEADSLLGKRSEVSDAHDRYANIEVAYLLQRLERYEGLAIMATNLLRNIDTAFLRRIHVIVEFAVPEPAERRRIWRRCMPP
ncbi:MAG TPA: ATP-binding protein [Acidimicrobiales bacterium]|nr:ATP-binding protein [Acidimicrobiales bacterium]